MDDNLASGYHSFNSEYGTTTDLLPGADWEGWSYVSVGCAGMFLNYCYYIPRSGWASVGARMTPGTEHRLVLKPRRRCR